MKQETKQKIVKTVFIVIGVLLILDTVFVRTRSNWNLGVILPALLGIPFLLYGIFKTKFDLWFQSKLGKFVKWFFICGYVFLAVLFAGATGMMLGAAYKQPPPEGAQAVIVLGAGIRGEEVSYALQNRLDKAAEYYGENPGTLLVVSGGYGQGKDVSEAQAMEKYLLSIGIPKDAIVKEERSTSTNENFRYSKELLDERFREEYEVVFATNDFHVLRARINAEEEGLTAYGLPAPTPLFIIPNCYMREALALLATYAFGA